MRKFWGELVSHVRYSRWYWRGNPDAPYLWPLRAVRDAVGFVWWRGVYWPVSDAHNALAWRYGWGEHRWRVRVGDVILVRDIPNTVRSVDYRKGLVVTDAGQHDLMQCCDPVAA